MLRNAVPYIAVGCLIFCAISCAEVPMSRGRNNAETLVSQAGTTVLAQKFDPKLAKVEITSEPKPVAASADGSMMVPGFSFKLTNADFVQIIRCAESYDFVTAQGTDVPNSKPGEISELQLEGAWMRAWNSSSQCEIVGSRSTAIQTRRESFADLTAGSGTSSEQKFFYILNPCVLEQRATTPGRNCSFKLVTTKPIKYTAVHQQKFLDRARELLVLENSLTSKVLELQFLAQETAASMEACNKEKIAHDAWQSRKASLANLASFGVSTFVSGVIGGPISSILVPKLAPLVSAAFGANASFSSLSCERISDYINSAHDASTSVTLLLSQVQNARIEMAKIEESYDKLSTQVAQENF